MTSNSSRRAFMKSTGALGVGLVTLPSLLAKERKKEDAPKKIVSAMVRVPRTTINN